MMGFIHVFYVAAVIVIFLGITIFVHEFGHFIAARLCGMTVDTFSLGFGQAIWKKKYKGTTYKIGWIFFGGYVALPQLDPEGMEKIQGDGDGDNPDGTDAQPPKKYPPVAAWKKIVVALAGATGNVILAIIIAWVVYWVGVPSPAYQRDATVGVVAEESDAFKQGLRVGDLVTSVNGRKVENWEDVLIECSLHGKVTLTAVSPEGEQKKVELNTIAGFRELRILDGVFGVGSCLIGEVFKGKSAEKAGLKAGDIILEFNDVRITSGEQFIAMVDKLRGKSTPIKVRRGSDALVMSVTPEFDGTAGRIGISLIPNAPMADRDIHPLPSVQLKRHATMIFRVLRALTTPGEAGNAFKGLGSPVVIVTSYNSMIRRGFAGLMDSVSFTCMLNVNLAILNLLPIPVLDGGLIVFALWELVRRRPANAKVVSALTNLFAVLIITLFVILVFRDIRWEVPEDTRVGRALTKIDRVVFGGAETPTNAVPGSSAGTNAAVMPEVRTNDATSPKTTP